MITYEKILGQIEDGKTINFVELKAENPNNISNFKDIGPIEKFHFYANYLWFLLHDKSVDHFLKSFPIFLFKKMILVIPKKYSKNRFSFLKDKEISLIKQEFFVKERFLNPIVKYLIKTHMRRQLKNLYKLYLREIISQDTSKNKEEIDDLRKTNTTVKDYIQELPNIKRFFLSLIMISFGVISAVPVLGLNTLISKFIDAEFDLFLILAISIPILIVFIISELFVNAFRIKRCKMMNTDLCYPCYDLYFGKGKEIYEKSVYKIENDLYEKLGKLNKKPKEIPIDKIFQLSFLGSFFIMLTGLLVIGIITRLITNQSIPIEIVYSIPVISLLTFVFFFNPIIKYRRRIKNNLY